MPLSTSEEEEDHYDDNTTIEATELQGLDQPSNTINGFMGSLPQDDIATSPTQNLGRYEATKCSIRLFWQRQVSATVAHDACRDHFGTYMLCDRRL